MHAPKPDNDGVPAAACVAAGGVGVGDIPVRGAAVSHVRAVGVRVRGGGGGGDGGGAGQREVLDGGGDGGGGGARRVAAAGGAAHGGGDGEEGRGGEGLRLEQFEGGDLLRCATGS